MIKFFRNIRQRLISENRFSKYLLYAIGEIVLVVIGILIALQINTWNEYEKMRKHETLYLNRLLKENKKDVESFTEEIERLENNNTTIQELSNAFKDRTSADTLLIRSAGNYMVFGSLYPIFNPSTSTYEDLSSTGNLSLIEDTELRDLIVKHYEAYEFVESNFKINIDWAIPIDSPLFINTNALQFDEKFTKSLFREESNEQLARELRTNEAIFLRNAALHYWINKDCIAYLKNIKKETTVLVSLIEEKLNRKSKT
ncbi:MAG: hypothetical protein CMC08_10170 [Flavobacteriaceae bacterium]|nr:hypothetical protein [Flavobacteriaceae bacterium]|tara:strand:- start:117 stop:887 length:771 start_codon:yes stop_codon:yes gene_type:complete